MKKEELIQELQVLCPYTLKGITGDVACGKIAEYILYREKLLLEKIGKPLYQWQSTQQKLVNCQCYICQALAIIEKEQTNNKEN